jgi:hypothetical protein
VAEPSVLDTVTLEMTKGAALLLVTVTVLIVAEVCPATSEPNASVVGKSLPLGVGVAVGVAVFVAVTVGVAVFVAVAVAVLVGVAVRVAVVDVAVGVDVAVAVGVAVAVAVEVDVAVAVAVGVAVAEGIAVEVGVGEGTTPPYSYAPISQCPGSLRVITSRGSGIGAPRWSVGGQSASGIWSIAGLVA